MAFSFAAFSILFLCIFPLDGCQLWHFPRDISGKRNRACLELDHSYSFPWKPRREHLFPHGGICLHLFLGPWIFLVYSVEAWNEDIGSLDMSESTHSVYDRLVLKIRQKARSSALALIVPSGMRTQTSLGVDESRASLALTTALKSNRNVPS